MAKNSPNSEIENRAWKYAEEKHKGQTRKFSGLPYFTHVSGVNDMVKKYIQDENILCAAILHDVIEDCFDDIWIGYYEIKQEFGQEIAEYVLMLTSDKNEIKYRYDGNKQAYLTDKMLKMYYVDIRILITKLCDRAKNIDDIFSADAKFRFKYYFETIAIMNALYTNLKNKPKNLKQVMEMLQCKLDNVMKLFGHELNKELN
jgi:(p)ppGpp synthase/HD superfamily hydrolase